MVGLRRVHLQEWWKGLGLSCSPRRRPRQANYRSPGTGDPEWGVISGAESSGYTPTAPYDVGKRLRVVVTYTDGTGTARGATSPATNRVDQRGVVGLSTSVPDVGIEVIATLADADEGVTDAVWRWQRSPNAGTPSWSDITDASDASYTPTTPDKGNLLRVLVDYDDAIGSGRIATARRCRRWGNPGRSVWIPPTQ